MDETSSRYLDAFNAIEKWLRDQTPGSERYDFPNLIDLVSERHHGVRRHASKLKELNRFRNFVVHDFSQNKAMAVPTTWAADLISAVRRELLSPEPLLSFAAKPVATCQPSDPITLAVTKMRDGKFSQIPVCENSRCLGLLTAETIARWLSAELPVKGGLVEEQPISEVLAHQEDPDNHTFVNRSANVDEALAAFEAFMARGKRLDAVLITQNGRSTEGLLGIVTINDVPTLTRSCLA
jgi:predicted transcriptional regulator